MSIIPHPTIISNVFNTLNFISPSENIVNHGNQYINGVLTTNGDITTNETITGRSDMVHEPYITTISSSLLNCN